MVACAAKPCCKDDVNAAGAEDTPTYIYKLVPHTSPVPLSDLPEILPVSALDQASGFVHASTAHQVPGTLARFFASDPRVYVLRMPYEPLAERVRWESPDAQVCGPRPGEGLFPHVYNGLKVGREEVESVWVLERGEKEGREGWEEAMMQEGFRAWLDGSGRATCTGGD